MRGCRVGLWLVAALMTGAPAAMAQTNTGEMSGLVFDPQGAVLPGTAVVAEHLESGAKTRSEEHTSEL